jgi:BirA family biotin operon repressor/biotin-[acetyl-CoA-carboxylase] ligase
VRERWRARLVTLGQRVTATTPSGVTEGAAEDVDTDGALLIRKDDGALATVEAGDVTLRE